MGALLRLSTLSLALCLSACIPTSSGDDNDDGDSGGVTGEGGATGGGGAVSGTGGAAQGGMQTGEGGTPASGGNPMAGGAPAMGGNPEMGGTPEMGGSPEMGGTPAMGGTPEMGGNPEMGGSPAPGGMVGEGGNVGEGGQPAAGPLDCAEAELVFNERWRGSSEGAGDDQGLAGCARQSTQDSEDVVFLFQAEEAGTYVFNTEGSEFDTVLHTRNRCGGPVIACNDDIGERNQASALTLVLDAGQSVLVVVDGYDQATGNLTMMVTGVEQSCDDEDDNDGDGRTDCEDTDCAASQACIGMDDWPPEWILLEQQMLDATNVARAAGALCGPYQDRPAEQFDPAPALRMNPILRAAARLHSQDMGAQNYFDHVARDGRNPFDRIRDVGFEGAQPWGENLAGGNDTAQAAVNGLMDSPGHCRNIMNPQYRVVGMGYAYERESQYRHYWTQKFAAGD